MEISKVREYLGVDDKAPKYATTQAILAFQKKHNMKETGMPCKELSEKIKDLKLADIRAQKHKQQKIRHPKFTH